jgi:hypothetical protein
VSAAQIQLRASNGSYFTAPAIYRRGVWAAVAVNDGLEVYVVHAPSGAFIARPEPYGPEGFSSDEAICAVRALVKAGYVAAGADAPLERGSYQQHLSEMQRRQILRIVLNAVITARAGAPQ